MLNIANAYMRAQAISARAPRARKYPVRVYTLASLSLFPSYHHHPSPPPLLSSPPIPPLSSSSPPRAPPPHTHTHTRTRTRAHALSPRPPLPSPLPRARLRPRFLRRPRVRARYGVVRCCCCCCCWSSNTISSCAIPGIEFREWYNYTSGLDSSLATSSFRPALARCAIAQPLLLLLLLLQHFFDGCCPWG